MSTVLLVARAELRSSARLLIGLAVMVAAVSGLVLATWAGAQRTETSIDRMRDATNARDLEIQVDADPAVGLGTARALVDAPGVAGVGTMTMAPAMVVADELGDELREGTGVGVLDDLGDLDVDRPRILAGRMPAPEAPDEVVVNEVFLEGLDAQVGDPLRLATFSPDGLFCFFMSGECAGAMAFDGPELGLEIVGVMRLLDDLQGSGSSAGPIAMGGPAFLERWTDEVGFFPPLAGVHLHPGADPAPVEAAAVEAARALGGPDTEILISRADELFVDSARDSVGVLADGLRIMSLVAAATGVIVIGQSARRHLAAADARVGALRPLGMGRSAIAASLGLPVAGAMAAGTALGVGVAVALSPLFPIGLGRDAEPTPGIDVEVTTMALGGLLLMASTVLVVAGLATWTSRTNRSDGTTHARRALGVARATSSPVVAFGQHLAFARGPRAARVAGSSAVAGMAVAVAGVLTALTMSASTAATVDQPGRWGWNWDSVASFVDPELAAQLVGHGDVDGAAWHLSRKVELDGKQLGGVAIEPVTGSLGLTVVRGRPPATAHEVALGELTVAELGTAIGRTVTGPSGQELEVVGTVVLPPNFDNPDTDRGAALTPEGLDETAVSEGFESLLLRYAPGSDARAIEEELAGSVGAQFTVVRPPGALANLDRATGMVRALAGFFAVLGAAGLLHALVLSGRRRRGEAAVVAALGFDRRQRRRSVVVQAVLTVAAGLVVGIPAGLVLGRLLWGLVIDGVGVVEVPTTPVVVALALVPLTLASAAAIALGPAWSAARRPPARDLRVE